MAELEAKAGQCGTTGPESPELHGAGTGCSTKLVTVVGTGLSVSWKTSRLSRIAQISQPPRGLSCLVSQR